MPGAWSAGVPAHDGLGRVDPDVTRAETIAPEGSGQALPQLREGRCREQVGAAERHSLPIGDGVLGGADRRPPVRPRGRLRRNEWRTPMLGRPIRGSCRCGAGQRPPGSGLARSCTGHHWSQVSNHRRPEPSILVSGASVSPTIRREPPRRGRPGTSRARPRSAPGRARGRQRPGPRESRRRALPRWLRPFP
jgi:hypothetical protein